MQPASKMKLAPAPWSAASPWFLSVPCLTSLVVLFDYFFNSMVVGVPCSLIFWYFWLFMDFILVVILLLVVCRSKGFIPMLPSWPELLWSFKDAFCGMTLLLHFVHFCLPIFTCWCAFKWEEIQNDYKWIHQCFWFLWNDLPPRVLPLFVYKQTGTLATCLTISILMWVTIKAQKTKSWFYFCQLADYTFVIQYFAC